MSERKRIVHEYDLNRKGVAAEFSILDAALQNAFDKHGEWYVREWLYSRLGRIQAMSRNRVPKKHRTISPANPPAVTEGG